VYCKNVGSNDVNLLFIFLDSAVIETRVEKETASGGESASRTGICEAEDGSISPGSSGLPSVEIDAIPGTSGAKKISANENETKPAVEEGSANVSEQGNNWLSYTELMSESYPSKSKVVYLKAFKAFEKYLKSKNQWKPNSVPTDLQLMNYFHFLRHDLKFAPTTLWSTYARINAVMKRVHGVSLNSYTRLGDVLKSYDSGHVVKQAGIFTPQQIEDFISDPQLSSKYWLVRKVVCLIGYYGGFRNVELKSLKFENCEQDSMGFWFTFPRAKQRGRVEETTVCIPRRQPDWVPVVSDSSRMGLDFDPASLLDLYLAEIESDLQCSREELKGDFFRATHGMKGQKFTQLPLGKNTIGRVGVQVATELCLPRPEIYTGHCWRRSCGTSASDSGVNVTTLMSMMGWSNPKTAMVYVKKSRLTSLSLALYLANVQRTNCPNPFPQTSVEKREAVKQNQGSKLGLVHCSKSPISKEEPESVSQPDDPDFVLATQDLIREIEAEESSVDNVVREVVVENKISSVDPRLSGILHNLQNTGNLNIHFHFDNQK
jgi:hypothetical protein